MPNYNFRNFFEHPERELCHPVLTKSDFDNCKKNSESCSLRIEHFIDENMKPVKCVRCSTLPDLEYVWSTQNFRKFFKYFSNIFQKFFKNFAKKFEGCFSGYSKYHILKQKKKLIVLNILKAKTSCCQMWWWFGKRKFYFRYFFTEILRKQLF